jgi:hypothetical protein
MKYINIELNKIWGIYRIKIYIIYENKIENLEQNSKIELELIKK